MDNINNKSIISFNTEVFLNELKILIPIYNKFFYIEDIFTSEISGKTRLNRQFFSDNHELIEKSILKINAELDEFLILIRQEMRNILSKCGEYEESEWINLVFDDENYIRILELDLNSKNIVRDVKTKCLKDISSLIQEKNRIFNLGHFIDMFDTTIFDRYLNKLGVEDLINSTIIFEVIDSYALQFEELMKFNNEINNINHIEEKVSDFNSLNLLMELHKRRADNFTYSNIKYKISIDYNIDVVLNKPAYLNKSYLENILSCFIEQSCLDVVKKELKKGKIQKQIDINITLKKGVFQIIVKNNGFEVRNIANLFKSDIDNKYILEAKNFANIINAKIEIKTLENEGMEYLLTLNLK